MPQSQRVRRSRSTFAAKAFPAQSELVLTETGISLKKYVAEATRHKKGADRSPYERSAPTGQTSSCEKCTSSAAGEPACVTKEIGSVQIGKQDKKPQPV